MIGLLRKVLNPLEIIALLISAVAFYISNLEILMIGMSVLAATYFLRSNIPLEGAGPRSGFEHLLINTICPKAAWIACSVVIVGSLFALLNLHGAKNMLMIGLPVLGISSIIMIVYAVTKSDGSKLFPILYRSVPVCLFGLYILMNKPA